jgi:hypothetical protein
MRRVLDLNRGPPSERAIRRARFPTRPGPTEEHLIQERAGILWRKRRLPLAEAAAHRRGLDSTFASHRETVKMALAHRGAAIRSERIIKAIRATSTDRDEDMREIEEAGPMTGTAKPTGVREEPLRE